MLTSYVQLLPPAPISEGATGVQRACRVTRGASSVGSVEPGHQLRHCHQTFVDSLQAKGFSTNFKITVGDPVAGATIEVVAPSRRSAIDTTNAVIQRYRSSAEALQTRYSVSQRHDHCSPA